MAVCVCVCVHLSYTPMLEEQSQLLGGACWELQLPQGLRLLHPPIVIPRLDPPQHLDTISITTNALYTKVTEVVCVNGVGRGEWRCIKQS